MKEKSFLILDINFDIADRLLLKTVLESEDFELVAITTHSGYYSSKKASEFILGYLNEHGMTLPIAYDDDLNIDQMKIKVKEDGDFKFKSFDYLEEEKAYKILYNSAKDSGKVNIISTGPLTNIAKAIKEYDDFTEYIDHLFMKACAFQKGDVTAFAEFNAFTDPHALDIVLEKHIDRFILPLDIIRDIYIEENELVERGHSKELKELLSRKYPQTDQDKFKSLLLFYLFTTPEAFIFEQMGLKVDLKEKRGRVIKDDTREKSLIVNRFNLESFIDYLKAVLK
ncbi:MAG: nucleoside hydrolase [Tissierellia bacterium]|nr:nucleoside hydrolase [Tissierellia bacterium]